jgi:hypothetical protein
MDGMSPGGKPMASYGDAAPAFSLGISRADIPGRVIPINSFTVMGFSAVGDPGAGARYVRGTYSGLMAIQDKAGTWFNLDLTERVARPEWFGDCSTDATGPINAAETALNAAGGGVLQFRSVVYLVSQVTKRSYTTWEGAGMGLTIIRRKANTTSFAVVAGLNAEALMDSGSNTGGISCASFRGLSVDGNSPNGGVGHGIVIYGAVLFFDRLEASYCTGSGWWSEFGLGNVPTGNTQKNTQSWFTNGAFHQCKDGFRFGGPNDSMVIGVNSYLNTNTNLWTYGNGFAKFFAFHGWSDAVGGPQAETCARIDAPSCKFFNSDFEGAKKRQVWLRNSNCTFVGCEVFYYQSDVAGVAPVGYEIGDATGEGGSVVASSLNEIHGRNFSNYAVVKFNNDGGNNRIEINGYTGRTNAPLTMGTQHTDGAGRRTNTIHLDVLYSVPSQNMDQVYAPGGTSQVGSLGLNVVSPQDTLDIAGGRRIREFETTGRLLREFFDSDGNLISDMSYQTGYYRDWIFKAFGVDVFRLKEKGICLPNIGTYASDADAGAAGLTQNVVYRRPDGSLYAKL